MCGSMNWCATWSSRCKRVAIASPAIVDGGAPSARTLAVFLHACCRRAMVDLPSRHRREFLEENGEEYLALQNALVHRVWRDSSDQRKAGRSRSVLARRAEELRVQLGFLMESNDRNTVIWIERRGELRRAGRAGHACVTASYADRCFVNPAAHAVCEPEYRRADVGDNRGGRRVRVHARGRLGLVRFARTGGALALRLRNVRRCSTFLRTCLIRAARRSRARRPNVSGRCWRSHGAGLLPVHQLCADARRLRATARGTRLPDADPRRCPQERAARRVPHDAQCGAVRDSVRSGKEWTCRANSSVA